MATVKEVAQKLGVSETQIKKYRNTFVGMAAQMGVFVKEHIGHYRGQTQLTEEDLGIEITENEKKSVKLGQQLLLPADTLSAIEKVEGQGRSNVERHGLSLMMGTWVPVTAWESFKEENDALKSEFFALRDALVAKYDAIIVQMREEFTARAQDVYQRLFYSKITAGVEVPSKAAWINTFVNKLIGKIPPKTEIHDSFYWKIDLEWMPSPSETQEEQLAAHRQQVERQKLMAEQAKLAEHKRLQVFQEEDRKKKIEEINQAIAAQFKEKQEAIQKERDSMLDQFVLQLRQKLYDVGRRTVVSLQRNGGKLQGASAKALKNTIEQMRLLNFYGDKEVAAYCDEIEIQIKKSGASRSAPKMEKLMKDIEDTMGKSVRAIERHDDTEMLKIMGAIDVPGVRSVE